jgi:hypothetical protein
VVQSAAAFLVALTDGILFHINRDVVGFTEILDCVDIVGHLGQGTLSFVLLTVLY